jgi:hypothetical protein
MHWEMFTHASAAAEYYGATDSTSSCNTCAVAIFAATYSGSATVGPSRK